MPKLNSGPQWNFAAVANSSIWVLPHDTCIIASNAWKGKPRVVAEKVQALGGYDGFVSSQSSRQTTRSGTLQDLFPVLEGWPHTTRGRPSRPGFAGHLGMTCHCVAPLVLLQSLHDPDLAHGAVAERGERGLVGFAVV